MAESRFVPVVQVTTQLLVLVTIQVLTTVLQVLSRHVFATADYRLIIPLSFCTSFYIPQYPHNRMREGVRSKTHTEYFVSAISFNCSGWLSFAIFQHLFGSVHFNTVFFLLIFLHRDKSYSIVNSSNTCHCCLAGVHIVWRGLFHFGREDLLSYFSS